MDSTNLRGKSRWIRVPVIVAAGFLSVVATMLLGQTTPTTNPSRPFGPDGCGPTDAAYIHAANETGGIPLFLQPSEAAKAFHMVRESTRPNVATVFWATGTFDGKSQPINIPVDSVTKRITFTFSTDRKGSGFKLTQPSGKVMTKDLAGTEITILNCGKILTINSPEAGEWGGEITGTGRYWIEAQAQSDIYFVTVEFVKQGGRPGHEGLFRIQGQPVVGTPATLQASLSAGATKTTQFDLVNEHGQIIQKLSMRAVNSDREFLEFVGRVELPNVPFRVAVAGRDVNGKQYQRFFSNLFHAESVQVSSKLDFDELPAGSTREITFIVENVGFPRTFQITVTDAHQFVTAVEPKEIALGVGTSGLVRVNLTVPVGTTPGVGDDIVIVAAASAGPPTSNSSVVHFSVSSPPR
jgi:von Willebrand factor A domain-containing protein 7